MPEQPFLFGPLWIPIRDGNVTGMSIFLRHYTARQKRKVYQFIGPGDKLPMLTPDAKALWVWRKFKSDAGETGVNCAVFRNEGTDLARSSELIRAADEVAWEFWPEENRHYTYVDAEKVRHKRDPGRCFIRAGWKKLPYLSKSGKVVLEILRPEKSPSFEGPPAH